VTGEKRIDRADRPGVFGVASGVGSDRIDDAESRCAVFGYMRAFSREAGAIQTPLAPAIESIDGRPSHPVAVALCQAYLKSSIDVSTIRKKRGVVSHLVSDDRWSLSLKTFDCVFLANRSELSLAIAGKDLGIFAIVMKALGT
jgi:hypothetical protein